MAPSISIEGRFCAALHQDASVGAINRRHLVNETAICRKRHRLIPLALGGFKGFGLVELDLNGCLFPPLFKVLYYSY